MNGQGQFETEKRNVRQFFRKGFKTNCDIKILILILEVLGLIYKNGFNLQKELNF